MRENDSAITDGDGWLDDEDNCPEIPNEMQDDSNGNGIGDARWLKPVIVMAMDSTTKILSRPRRQRPQ